MVSFCWSLAVGGIDTYFLILSLNRPAATSRYTCNSTRWPGAGLRIYLHTVGPIY